MHVRTLSLIAIFMLPLPGLAQDTRATLTGRVVDEQSAPIVGAAVTAVADLTAFTTSAATDGEGRYRLPLLPPGLYTLVVEAPGFAPTTQAGIDLRVGEERRADVVLRVSGIETTVTVTAPLTNSRSGTLAAVLPQERINRLPLNGRQLQELTLTVPGVSAAGGFRSSAFNQFGLATPADGNAGAFAVNGAPSRANGFFLDGVDINIPEQGVIAFPPLVDAVQEAEIETSGFKAEYGRYSGAIVNYITRAGSNVWRGTAYGYYRDDAFDANDFFNKVNGLPKTTLNLKQLGGSIGGPLLANRHFIFGNYEANRVKQGTGPFASNVPTADQRRGLIAFTGFTDLNGNGRFDAGEPTAPAVLDIAGRVSPISRAINDGFIPLPNASGAGANYIANGLQTMTEDAFVIRTDSQWTDRDRLSVRYHYDFQDQFFPFDVFFVSASLPAFPFPNPERRQSLAASHTRTIGNTAANELRFGLNRQSNPIINGTDIDPATIGLPNGAPQNEFGRGLPIIRITGFGGTGGQPYTDNLGASTTTRTVYQFIDSLQVSRGAHGFKFGVEVRHSQVDSSAYRPLRGALTFNGSRNGLIDPSVPGNAAVAAFTDFLLGLPAQATISSANPTRRFRTWAFSAYAQDDWQVSDRLTLNLGLRYELDTPLTEADGLLSNLVPGVGNFVVGSAELPRLHRLDANNLAPRVSGSLRLDDTGRTVLRGAFGVYYDNGVFQDRFATARTNAPFAITAIDNDPAPFPMDGTPATTFTRLLGSGRATSAASIDTDYHTPLAVQYNVGFERELVSSLVGAVGYVGRRAYNQSRPANINQVVAVNSPAATVEGRPVGSRPFNNASVPEGARFSNDIIQQQFNGRSVYHALQARLERRAVAGSSFLLAYTWSSSRDNGSGIGTGVDDRPQDSYDLDAHWGPSNYDIPHRFVASGTWALPFGAGRRFLSGKGLARALAGGWHVDGILTLQSGQPFTVTVGAFDPVLGISNKRPHQLADPLRDVPQGFAFNPAAFAAPPVGELGRTGRNTLRGDGYTNLDLALSRSFPLPMARRTADLQVRAELFNVLNTVNFNFPVTALSSPAFGRYVSNATAPRIAQFSARLSF
ncbi:MAG: carboxypeptidase regulatory-like domain-containing protein [Acidobacteriota bacterium]